MGISKPKLRTTSVRIPEDEIREIDKLSREEAIDRGAIVRKLIGLGLREFKAERAFEKYRRGSISLWRAATLAGLTYREALEELKRRNIPFRYGGEDLRADVEWALRK
jgi:predicted HTH domain antitoxin